MEIKEGTLVVSYDQGFLGLVIEADAEEERYLVSVLGDTLSTREKYLIPLAQTDGQTKDPRQALQKHLSEVIIALACMCEENKSFMKLMVSYLATTGENMKRFLDSSEKHS